MTQLRRSDTSIVEIEELISFAERVSDRIRTLEDNLSKSRVEMMSAIAFGYLAGLSAVGLLFLKWTTGDTTFLLASCGLIILCPVSFVVWYSRHLLRRRSRDELEVELRVVGDLVQMASSLLEGLDSDSGVVTRALLDMRLRRIKFSDRRVM